MRLLDSCSGYVFHSDFWLFNGEIGSFFLPSLYFPLIMPLETENIPSVLLDQDVNLCFCI